MKFAGEDAFKDMLSVFTQVGKNMKAEIDEFLGRDRS